MTPPITMSFSVTGPGQAGLIPVSPAGEETLEVRVMQDMSEAEIEAVLAMPAFRRWLSRLVSAFTVSSVAIERVVLFGRRPGFVLASAQALDAEGRAVPATVFLRGDSVAVLPVLVDPRGRHWTVLVRQARTAVGATAYEEIPAGMLDGGAFASKALDELREETGVDLGIRESELVLLEEVHPSPGACDESIRIYAASVAVGDDTLAKLTDARAGCADENESIRVEVIPLGDLAHRASADAKARLAYYAWCALQGTVPTRMAR